MIVTFNATEDEDSLLQVRTRGSISLAQAKQMTRSLPLVPPQSPDLQHLQQQKRPKSHPSESEEKKASMAGESASTKPEESVVGYLSESDMVRYFVMFENVFNKMHGLSVQSDKERRGKESVRSGTHSVLILSEPDDADVLLSIRTWYGALREHNGLRLSERSKKRSTKRYRQRGFYSIQRSTIYMFS